MFSSTSELYSSFSISNTSFASFIFCSASSFESPTKFGNSTSFGFVKFIVSIVPPNANTNNIINPTIELKTLCFFINIIKLFSFLFLLFVLLLYSPVDIFWVLAVGS